jgi:hypothetical protein
MHFMRVGAMLKSQPLQAILQFDGSLCSMLAGGE